MVVAPRAVEAKVSALKARRKRSGLWKVEDVVEAWRGWRGRRARGGWSAEEWSR